ncbi:MAG: T9SS type A sorting domain-containing protein [Bacteroidetes bacterium]|nr:T9SS type A sorting domain-containing protein [Bacteroidota bacterium]
MNSKLVFLVLLLLHVYGLQLVAGQSLGSPCARAQSYHIVVLGSSTAAGSGPSSPDSTWVNRYRRHLQTVNPANLLTNLAVGGFTTYRIMPTGYTPPPGRPTPDVTHNITQALSLNPDAIIINMPSNDVSSGFTVAEQLRNFDTIIDLAALAGVPVWITTTQPKNYTNPQSVLKQIEVRDSIYARYGSKAIDFWTTIAAPNGWIDTLYDSGDGTHLNNAAHGILCNRVIAEFIPDSLFLPLPFVDLAALSLSPVYAPVCGDPQSIFRASVANFGQAATNSPALTMLWENLTTNQQGQLVGSLAVLGTCDSDSFDFMVNTATAGYYRMRVWVVYPGDLAAANDTTEFLAHFSGIPTLTGQSDTLCGIGQMPLSVIVDPQDTVFWYDSQSGGSLVGNGPLYLTPNLSTTTTYFAEAVRGNLFEVGQLSTTLNSGVNWNGAMMDVRALTALTIDSFGIKINSLGMQTVGIYTKSGTHIGFQTNPGAWTLLGTTTVQVNNSGNLTQVPLGGLSLNAGDTMGLYFYLQNTASTLSYNSVSQPQTRSNAEIAIFTGSGVSTGFSNSFYPRDLNARVYYHHGSRPLGDCSTGRIPVTAVLSQPDVALPADTIIDFNASLLLSAPSGFVQYHWSTGDSGNSLLLTGMGLGTGIHHILLTVTDSVGCFASDTIVVGVAYLLATTSPLENDLVIWPNPAGNFVSVRAESDLEDGLLRFFNLAGQLRSEHRLLAGHDEQIDIRELAAGVYFVEFQTGDRIKIYRQRLIVQR